MGLFDRFRADEPAAEPTPRPVAPRRAPSAGVLRRERRALLRAREERIRDLGGLMLEMYRRGSFREDLMGERCAEVLVLDERLAELDRMLDVARGRGTGVRCECGAPILWGSHFCANCGRPAGAAPVVSCSNCGRPLPAEAKFCGFCGATLEPAAPVSEETVVEAAPASAERAEA